MFVRLPNYILDFKLQCRQAFSAASLQSNHLLFITANMIASNHARQLARVHASRPAS